MIMGYSKLNCGPEEPVWRCPQSHLPLTVPNHVTALLMNKDLDTSYHMCPITQSPSKLNWHTHPT